MKKKWTVKHDCRNMSTNEIIDTILQDRGVEDIHALLYPDESCLIQFEKMKNIILIGVTHHNTLTMVRCLGKVGYGIDLYIYGDNNSYIRYSRNTMPYRHSDKLGYICSPSS